MQMTIKIPDNIPKKVAIKQIRELERRFREEAELFTDESGRHDNGIQNFHPETMNRDEEIYLDKLKKLVRNGHISEAREVLASIPSDSSSELNSWRKMLSPPILKQKKTATGGSIKEDTAWLRKNAGLHQGKWVALKLGKLLGSHESKVELYRNLKQSGMLDGAMFFKLEDKEI